ncbi:hypothetical protein EDC94DRAFT_684699 [Helicostylum pulchrum]|nr:hypothetical protein EDC94DRAFT_684699 [Helicostylum pulchrum]
MSKLSSGHFVEEVMKEFISNLNYEHPSCLLILDIDDKNWADIFSAEELNEIKITCIEKDTKISLPKEMGHFLDNISNKTNVVETLNYINARVFDSAVDRSLYWLKIALRPAANLFISSLLTITDHSE